MPTWNSPGTYTWDVPDSGTVEIIVDGAAGGDGYGEGGNGDFGNAVAVDSPGDSGGRVVAEFDAADLPSQVTITVGGGGGNASAGSSGSGGASGGGSGGGATYDFPGATAYAYGGGGGGVTKVVGSDGVTYVVAGAGGGGGASATTQSESDISSSSGGSGGSSNGSLGGENGGGGESWNDENGDGFIGGGGGGGAGSTGGSGGTTNAQVFSGTTQGLDSNGGGGGQSYADSAATSTSFGSSNTNNDGSVEILTDPQAPQNVTQSIEGDDQISVDADENPTGSAYDNYRIEVSEDGGAYTHVASPASMPYQYAATPSVDEHQFRVRGENNIGTSDWVETTTKSTDITSVTISNTTGTGFDVDWDAADDSTDYDVLVAEASGSVAGDYSVDQTVSGTSATVTGRENGEQFFVRVIARYPQGDSLSMVEASTTTSAPAPSLDTIDDSVEDELTVGYTRNDNSSDGDVLVEYSTDGGQSWSEAGTVADLQASSFTHVGRPDGTTHAYRVTRRTDHDSATSGTLSATTILPNPSGFQVVAARETKLDGEWTDNHDTGTTKLQYRRSSDSQWSGAVTGLAIGTEAATADGLSHGEEYDLRAVAITDDAASASSIDTATTVLPDLADGDVTLGNGIEDEVAVTLVDTINYGSYRVQIRETGQGSWDANATGYDEQVLNHDNESTIFPGKEDGEEYEVRARVETEHETGEWTTPVSIVTHFPGLSALAVDSTGQTSADLSATDNSDNEDGTTVERRQRYGSSWGEWRDVETVDPQPGDGNTLQYTDDTVRPGREYEWRMTQFTEHASHTTNAVGAEADSSGLRRYVVEPDGWHVEVMRSTGEVVRPTTLEDAEWIPRTNALPKVRIPVEKSDRWTRKEYEEQPMRVWKDGRLVAVDELENVIEKDDRVLLEARGGLELLGRTEAFFDDIAAHDAAEQVINDDTSYIANVDDPASSTTPDSLVQAADDQESMLNQIDATIPDDDPRYIENGVLGAYPVGWLAEGENISVSTSEVSRVQYSNNRAAELDAFQQRLNLVFTPQYDIPAGDLLPAYRMRIPNDGHPSFQMQLDGGSFDDAVIENVQADGYAFPESEPNWETPINNLSGTLEAGTEYTVRLYITGDGSDSNASDPVIEVDLATAFDTRNLGLGDIEGHVQTGLNEYATPAPIPPEVQFETATTNVTRDITAASFSGTFDNPADTTIELSPDEGDTWPVSGSDSAEVSGEFPSLTTSVRSRITLNTMHGDTIPLDGWDSRELDAFEVRADLDDTPILTDYSRDDSTLAVLQRIADFGNYVFEVRKNDDGDTTIEWTQPGLRDGSLDGSVGSYETEKNTERSFERVVIKGGAVRVRSEGFTADHGTAVDLDHEYIVDGSEAVYDPNSEDETQFDRGDDYSINTQVGAITALATGDMEDGTEYEVDYRRKAKGEYTIEGAGDNPKTYTDTIPDLTTEQACESAALYVAKEVQSPVHSAEITVDEIDPGTSMVANLSLPEGIDTGGVAVPREVSNMDGKSTVRLGSREDAGEILERMKDTISGAVKQI